VTGVRHEPQLLDVVALLTDAPEADLVAGHVGTVVEALDANTVLVEFATDEGEPYAVAALPKRRLLILRYEPVGGVNAGLQSKSAARGELLSDGTSELMPWRPQWRAASRGAPCGRSTARTTR